MANSKEEKAAEPKMWTIKTPVEGFNGFSMGVAFQNSVGHTDNEWLAQRFKESGYEVE